MSVFKHDYRPYTGRVTPLWSRVRWCWRATGWPRRGRRRSRSACSCFRCCPAIVDLIMIYLANNPVARMLIMRGRPRVLAINERFLPACSGDPVLVCAGAGGVDCAATGLVRPGRQCAADSAEPSHFALRLCAGQVHRAGSFRSRYVTWIPCLLLFVYQCYASPQPWAMAHLQHRVRAFLRARRCGSCCSRWSGWRFRPG